MKLLTLVTSALTASCFCQAQSTILLKATAAKLSGPDLRIVTPYVDGSGTPANALDESYITGFRSDADQAEFSFNVRQGGVYVLSMSYRSNERKSVFIED